MPSNGNAALVRRITESWPERTAELDGWIREVWEPDGGFYPDHLTIEGLRHGIGDDPDAVRALAQIT